MRNTTKIHFIDNRKLYKTDSYSVKKCIQKKIFLFLLQICSIFFVILQAEIQELGFNRHIEYTIIQVKRDIIYETT